jgi:hypothetical protein
MIVLATLALGLPFLLAGIAVTLALTRSGGRRVACMQRICSARRWVVCSLSLCSIDPISRRWRSWLAR